MLWVQAGLRGSASHKWVKQGKTRINGCQSPGWAWEMLSLSNSLPFISHLSFVIRVSVGKNISWLSRIWGRSDPGLMLLLFISGSHGLHDRAVTSGSSFLICLEGWESCQYCWCLPLTNSLVSAFNSYAKPTPAKHFPSFERVSIEFCLSFEQETQFSNSFGLHS